MAAFLLLIVGQGALLAGSWAIAAASRRRGYLCAGILLIALLAKAALAWRPDWESALFPWTDYARFQRLWLYLIAAGFFGCALGLLPAPRPATGGVRCLDTTRLRRPFVLALALFVVGWGIAANRWLAWPETHGDARTAGPDHHCQQSTAYTCAPTACLIAASYCGVVASERAMAERCLTHDGGTSLFDIYRGLRLSLPADRWQVTIEAVEPADLARPGQLAITTWVRFRHAICTVGAGDHVLVHDPLAPVARPWPLSTLAERFDGMAVLIRPR